jgi:putative phosphoribosyl transferase
VALRAGAGFRVHIDMHTQRYADRAEAGRQLAGLLGGYAGRDDVTVLGLPRGGVPVAHEVARLLPGLLDVLVVRKLGLPNQPELAMGAIAGVADGVELARNDQVIAHAGVTDRIFDEVYRREEAELRRREAAYRPGGARAPVAGRTVIVVDDGVATGSTMLAALAAVHAQRPERLVVAVPVGAAATLRQLRAHADEVVCGLTPEPFHAVGQAYDDFRQIDDGEVRRLLAAPA